MILKLVCRRVGRLKGGQYFGEYACFTGDKRTASVIAITVCELYSLSKDDLKALVIEWPEIREELKFTGALPSLLHLPIDAGSLTLTQIDQLVSTRFPVRVFLCPKHLAEYPKHRAKAFLALLLLCNLPSSLRQYVSLGYYVKHKHAHASGLLCR